MLENLSPALYVVMVLIVLVFVGCAIFHPKNKNF